MVLSSPIKSLSRLPSVIGTSRHPWGRVVDLLSEAERLAALFRARLDLDRPPHVGVFLDNTPDYVFTLCGAGLAGVAVAGLNHTRHGDHLTRDILHTDVQ